MYKLFLKFIPFQSTKPKFHLNIGNLFLETGKIGANIFTYSDS